MNMSLESMLQLSIIFPWLAVIGIVASASKPNLRETISIGTSIVVLFFVINLYSGLKQGAFHQCVIKQM